MKVAIMQPYFLPYIGYFQLIAAVDVFVIYDDVNFIKKGYINRNSILVNGQSHMFSIPLSGASQNKLINEIELDGQENWGKSFLKTVEMNYKKSPHFAEVFPLLENITRCEERILSRYVTHSIQIIANYLNLKTRWMVSSEIDKDNTLKGQDKIIEINKRIGATHYINPIGGTELYDRELFKENGLELSFIKAGDVRYKQFNQEFVPWLSMLDVLMFNSKEELNVHLGNFSLLN